MNNMFLAQICNDLENHKHYKVIDGKAYFKDKYIGDYHTELTDDSFNVYFRPTIPVKKITVSLNILADSETII